MDLAATVMTQQAPSALDVERLHRAADCFHALLSVLQTPLSAFVAVRGFAVSLWPLEPAQEIQNAATADLKAELQLISSSWDSHFSAVAPWGLVTDLNELVQIVDQPNYTVNTSLTTYLKGIAAIERLLVVVEADVEAVAAARVVKSTLRVDESHGSPTTHALESPRVSDEDTLATLSSPQFDATRPSIAEAVALHDDDRNSENVVAQVGGGGVGAFLPSTAASTDVEVIMAIESRKSRRKALFKLANHLRATAIGAPADAIRVVTLALELANSKQQRFRMLVHRMEWLLDCGHDDLARQDALAAKPLVRVKTIELVARLAAGLRATKQWNEAAEVYEQGLSKHPKNGALRAGQRRVLQQIAAMGQDISTANASVSESPPLQAETCLHVVSAIPRGTNAPRAAIDEFDRGTFCLESNASDDNINMATISNSAIDLAASSTLAGSGDRVFVNTPALCSKENSTLKKQQTSEKMALAEQAKRVLSTVAFLKGKAKDDAKREVIRLASAALQLCTSQKQRCKMLTLRSDCYLRCGDEQLALQDACAALMPLKMKKLPMLRLINVFLALKCYREAAQAYDIALKQEPNDYELQQGKRITLAMAVEAEGGMVAASIPPSVVIESSVTSAPDVSMPTHSPEHMTSGVTKIVEWQSYFKKMLREGLACVATNDHASGNKAFTKALSWLSRTRDYKTDTTITKARVVALGHRARCRLAMQSFKTAARDARKGIGLQDDWIDGYRLLFRACMGAEQLQDALVACKSVLLHAPHDTQFQELLKGLREKSGSDEGNQALAELPARLVLDDERTTDEVETRISPSSETLAANCHSSCDGDGETFATIGGSKSIPEACLQNPHDGSSIARRYGAAQLRLAFAQACLAKGDTRFAFDACREALQLWPDLTIPRSIGDALLLVGPHNAVAWGGPMLFFTMEVNTIHGHIDNYKEERNLWLQRIERYPNDVQLRTKLAFVHHKGKEINGVREQTEKAFALLSEATKNEPGRWKLLSTAGLQYLRACSFRAEVPSSSFPRLSTEQRRRSRKEELLKYVEQATVDDEWVPYAYYSLGMGFLLERDYRRAKQFHFIAQEAESRRMELQLFPAIQETDFFDKKILNRAFCGQLMALSAREQHDTVMSGTMGCGWCLANAIPLADYVRHKDRTCPCRSSCPV